jgi:hypothetical protein
MIGHIDAAFEKPRPHPSRARPQSRLSGGSVRVVWGDFGLDGAGAALDVGERTQRLVDSALDAATGSHLGQRPGAEAMEAAGKAVGAKRVGRHKARFLVRGVSPPLQSRPDRIIRKLLTSRNNPGRLARERWAA